MGGVDWKSELLRPLDVTLKINKKYKMQKNILLLFGLMLLVINILFIGLLKYNESNIAELFIKYKPSSIFIFSSENQTSEGAKNYKEFISDFNIQDGPKSFLPLILIQLMLSSFILSGIKTDMKRKLALFAFHFVICLVGLFQVIALALNERNEFLTIIILISVIVVEFLIMKLFAPKKLQEREDTSSTIS